jgi:UDP-MurNAc hydroxylase
MAPTVRANVGAVCLLNAGDLAIAIDFPNGEVRAHAGEPFAFRFDIQRELVETVAARHAVDWSNALFLSCRFTAWRAGAYNEYLYNFFKSLSVERMRRTEAEAIHKADPTQQAIAGEEILIGDYICQRTCPHRSADLTVFGEIDGDELVCTLHGWRFDLETGACLTADDRRLRIRRA